MDNEGCLFTVPGTVLANGKQQHLKPNKLITLGLDCYIQLTFLCSP